MIDQNMPRRYAMLIEWDPADQIYVVTIPELPGCRTDGATYDETVVHGQEAIESWIEAAIADGDEGSHSQERSGLEPVSMSASSEIRPIRTEADYEAALADVERLWGAKSGTPQGDRLDVLATLIDRYESEHFPIDTPDPVEAIRFRMEQQGLTRKDLEAIFGTRTRVAEVLNRKRGLSIRMIRLAHEKLGIPAEILIRPSRVA